MEKFTSLAVEAGRKQIEAQRASQAAAVASALVQNAVKPKKKNSKKKKKGGSKPQSPDAAEELEASAGPADED